MKKLYIPFMALASFLLFSCDPLDNRDELTGGVTGKEIHATAVPQLDENGKRTNYIEVNSDGNDCLSSWDYGPSVFAGTSGVVQLLTSGDNEIIYTGRYPDGSTVEKTIIVNVEELYDVAPQWGYLCGNSEKEWTWDGNNAVWGNGGYLGSKVPEWWTVNADQLDEQEAGEGAGASMIFAIRRSAFTKIRTDGTTQKGMFSFDMDEITLDEDGNVWGEGKLYLTDATVLCGIFPNYGDYEDLGRYVYEYDIMKLNDNEMVLSYSPPGAEAWSTGSFFWRFKAK